MVRVKRRYAIAFVSALMVSVAPIVAAGDDSVTGSWGAVIFDAFQNLVATDLLTFGKSDPATTSKDELLNRAGTLKDSLGSFCDTVKNAPAVSGASGMGLNGASVSLGNVPAVLPAAPVLALDSKMTTTPADKKPVSAPVLPSPAPLAPVLPAPAASPSPAVPQPVLPLGPTLSGGATSVTPSVPPVLPPAAPVSMPVVSPAPVLSGVSSAPKAPAPMLPATPAAPGAPLPPAV